MLRFIKEKPTVPTLRFGLGIEPFERKRLDEIASKKISYGIVQAGDHVPGGMPYIKSQDLNGLLTLEKLDRTSEEIAKKYRRSEVRPGDIVFSLRGNIGVAQIVPESISVSNLTQGTARISVGEEYNKYVYCTLQSSDIARQVEAYAKGSTFREISLEDLRKVTVAIPSLPEQRKIANFLTAVDGRIGQLIQKRALLEDYKKGVMQQLFTQAIRFQDDHGNGFPDWEEKNLGEVCRVKKGEQLNKESLEETGLFRAINGGISPSGFTDKFNSNADTITISEGGNSCGFVNFIRTKFWSGGHCYSLEDLDTSIHKDFLFQTLKYKERRIMALRVGSGLPNIQKKDINNFVFICPSPAEQTKIADFLSAIDRKIESVATQITETQTFKRGLLQQMFV